MRMTSDATASGTGRREFLKRAAALPAAAAVAAVGGAGVGAATGAVKAQASVPTIRIGSHDISRLVCGANPFNAGSHLSTFVDREMRAYHTPEQITKTLRRCYEVGITCWQGGSANLDLYRGLVDGGCPMHFIAIASGDDAEIRRLRDGGCIGIAHHGEATDNLFRGGKLDQVNAYLKRVRDAGLAVGVSTHMPDVVDAIESRGWDVDYYMTCVYERHRDEKALKALLGYVPLPPREVYLREDPPRMFKAIRATKRPCLAFKILAAGRLSDRKEWVERAFRETLSSIKPTDGVIIGIYDRYSDQPAECAALVRRFGGA